MKTRPWVTALLVGGALLVGWGVYSALRTQAGEGAGIGTSSFPGVASGEDLEDLDSPTDSSNDGALERPLAGLSGSGGGGRTALEVSVHPTGIVRGPSGEPLAGIAVSWTPTSILSAWSSSAPVSSDEISALSFSATTAENGEFRLAEQVAGEPGVVWLTGWGWLADSRLLVGADWRAGPVGFSLVAGEAVWVRVVDGAGEPVEGARVVEQGTRGMALSLRKAEQFYVQVQAFLREGVTGSDGLVAMFSGPALARFQAFAPDGRSTIAVTAPTVGQVELHLEKLVEIGGHVIGFEGLGPALVAVFVEEPGHKRRHVETLDVLEDGRLLGRSVARIGEGVYRLQLEGPSILPQVVRVSPPSGGTLSVEFTATPAAILSLRFVSEDGEAVDGVRVRFNWDKEGGGIVWNAADVYSDQDGLVDLACPPGYVFPSYSHPEYLNGFIDGLLAPGEPGERREIVLEPFASISGRVLQAGRPVSNFSVAYEGALQEGGLRVKAVAGQEDGTFVLPKVPTGRVTLLAYADHLPQSDPVTLELLPGQSLEIDLELPASRTGRGIVVGLDGAAPEGVSVDRFLRTGIGSIAVTSTPVQVGFDGSFQIEGLSALREQLTIQGGGYSPTTVAAFRDSNGEYDFGTVVLERTSSVALDVLLPQGADPTKYSIRVSGGAYAGPMAIPQDRQVLVQPAKRGYIAVNIESPSGSEYNFDLKFDGVGPWSKQLDLTATGEVVIQLLGDFDELPDGAWFAARAKATWAKSRMTTYGAVSGKTTVLGGLARVPTSISLVVPGGVPVGVGKVTPGAPGEVVLEFDTDAPRWKVRVVDMDGSPVPGALVRVFDLEEKWQISASRTGEDGDAAAGPLPFAPVALNVTGPSGAKATNIVVAPGEAGDVYEVELDATARIDLIVADGPVTLDGLDLWVLDAVSHDNIAWPRVGLGGTWEVEHLSQGDYLLEPQSAYVWYELKQIHVGPTSLQETVQFRRKASLRVVVENAYGKPAKGRWVTLRSVEYGTDVGEWLGEGRAVSATGLVTDADGVVEVTGVPRGLYSWSVGGEAGEVDAPALGVGVVEVKLAP